MNNRLCALMYTALLTLLGAGPLAAQTLGNAFSYQGLLKESGLPANGLYDFQSCLFDSLLSPSTTFCAPDINDAPVEAGLFTIALDFGAGPFNGQQRYLELRVRPGASTGSYTLLSPRQLIRATPEALRANTAPWSGITALPTGFVDGVDNVGISSLTAGAGLAGGTITTTGTVAIASGGVTTSMIANDAVGTAQVAVNAIESTRILDNSINAIDIATNAVGALELDDNAVNTAAIVDGNVTSIKIANGAIGTAQINTAQVQARINGSCSAGEYFRGINADGSLSCELLPVSFDRVLESNGDVGSSVSIALRADGRPVVAHHNNTLGSLRLFSCLDAACVTGLSRTLDSAGADVGEKTSIAIRPNGFPVVVYRDVAAQSLKLYDCASDTCTSGTVRILDDSVNVSSNISMVLRADGRPLIAYYEFTNFTLRAYDCANLTCSSGAVRSFSSTNTPSGLDIQIRADGRPMMALGGNPGSPVRARLFDCIDADCTSGTLRTPPSAAFAGPVALLIRSTDRPLLVTTGAPYDLSVSDCADAICSTNTQTLLVDDATDAIDMKLRSTGLPLILYGEFLAAGQSDLRLFDCTNSGCSAGSIHTIVSNGDVGKEAAFALRSDGRPVIAYYDAANDDLRLRVCANPECI
jgi:hypothetical protein